MHGQASWQLRSITAELTVTKITADTIELWSVSDFSEAINAHYVGTLKDGIVEGEATWTKRDTGQHWTGHWYASLSPAALHAKLGIKVTAGPAPAPPSAGNGRSAAEMDAAAHVLGPRRAMRLCSQAGCQTLTWADGIYEGRSYGSDTVTTNFAIVRWEPGGIEFTGVVLAGTGNGDYPTGVFTGKIAPSGTEIEGGTDAWRIGEAGGAIPYTLKWIANEAVVPQIAPSTAKLPPEIKLCRGQCFRLRLEGGHYDAYSTEGERPEKVATYSVASFAPDSVYMQLVEKGGPRALLVGTIKDNAIVGGKVIWLNANRGLTSGFNATWGSQVQSDFKTAESLHPEPCKTSGSAGPAVKVDADVMEKQLVRRVAVIYPDGMYRMARMQGSIFLDAVITPCGTVSSAAVSGNPGQVNPALLGSGAVIAVKKWLYKPYLVNGRPVSVKTQIHVKVSVDEPDGAVSYPNGPAKE